MSDERDGATLPGYAGAEARPDARSEAVANTLPADGVRPASTPRIVVREPATEASSAPKVVVDSEGATLAKAGVAGGGVQLPRLDRNRYETVDEVGRGGLGRVLRARDVYLDRHVAVKELLDPDEAAQRRFVREALITARLQHPAIVPIYDAGQSADDDAFYAMKLVNGRSLAEVLREVHTLDERLALLPAMITVADAMAYAHSQSVVHRDLKPQNVLVGDFRETIIIDWGLAKDLSAAPGAAAADSVEMKPGKAAASSSSQASQTIAGSVMGTPAYMSPEQALGEEVDATTDVYSLGAMLYHLVTGEMPREGRSVDELLVKAATGEVRPIAELEPRVPVDLAAIIGKAMAYKPGQRYRTARELAEDLHKFQTGQLVGAYTYTRGERFQRWLRKHAGMVAVGAIATAILVGYGAWSIREMVRDKRRAQASEAEALIAKQAADTNAAEARTRAMLVRAQQYAASGHTAEEIAVLRALAAREDSRDLAIANGFTWKAHQRLAMGLGREVQRVHRSSDAARFVAVETHLVRAWDVASGIETARLPLAPTDVVAAISPGGSFAAIAACTPACTWEDGAVVASRSDVGIAIRELATGATPVRWTAPRLDTSALAFAADDSALAYRLGDKLSLVPLPSGTAAELDATGCGAFAVGPRGPSGNAIALACGDDVRVVRAGVEKRFTAGKAQLAFASPDRVLAVTAERVLAWDAADGELHGRGDFAPRSPDAFAGSPRQKELAWAVLDKDRSRPQIVQLGDIRIVSARPVLPRAAVTAPAVRVTPGLRIATFDGDPWRAIALSGEHASIAMVDELLPTLLPSTRCIARAGGEQHALVALDRGERLLVDEQEIATGLGAMPQQGYAQTTATELPVRQLRPAVAAESDACLVWGSAKSATVVDGGSQGAARAAVLDDAGGIVVASDAGVAHVAATGARVAIDVEPDFALADTGKHVASLDLRGERVVIRETARGAIVRTWAWPKGARIGKTIEWKAADVVEIDVETRPMFVPVDAALPVRDGDPELVTDARSPYGIRVDGKSGRIVRVADGTATNELDGLGGDVHVFPDDTGRVLVYDGKGSAIVARDGSRVALAPNLPEAPISITATRDHVIAQMRERAAVYAVATGKAVPLPREARAAGIAGDEVWALVGLTKPRLARTPLGGGAPRMIDLATLGLPFHHLGDTFEVAPDRSRITAWYWVTEEVSAMASWDASTGALLWVGPPASTVAGSWHVAGGRVFIPRFDIDALLRDTGERTNLRVCEHDLRAVPVNPPPAADTYWAPESACKR